MKEYTGIIDLHLNVNGEDRRVATWYGKPSPPGTASSAASALPA